MLKDSQRDNTDVKARACEEKSVVIMNTNCLHVNTIAKFVFDMMLHSELEVTGRSFDSEDTKQESPAQDPSLTAFVAA